MKCKPNCASGGTLSKTRLASCSSEFWRDPLANTGEPLRLDTGRILCRIHRQGWDPLAIYAGILSGILGGIHWLAGCSAGSTGEPLWRDTRRDPLASGSTCQQLWRYTRRDPLAELFGGILVHCRTPLAGYWTGSTGGIVWRDTGPLPDSSGGILDGIHWQNCLAGYWAGSTGGLVWRDTGRDTGRNPLAELFGGILGGPLADSSGRDPLADHSGGILGGIHWRTPLAGYWAESSLAGGCGVAASQTWILLEI